MNDTTAITPENPPAPRKLRNPPIVEAIIQINAAVTVPWEEASVVAALKAAVPELPKVEVMKIAVMETTFNPFPIPDSDAQTPAGWTPLASGFNSVRMRSEDEKWIAIFGRDFMSLSRLRPYRGWEQLCEMALRLWKVHATIGRPETLNRIACRYINRIEVPIDDLNISDYLRDFGGVPAGFHSTGFMHHEVLGVPGRPFVINFIRAHQMPVSPDGGPPTTLPLILDIEVVLEQAAEVRDYDLATRLDELRGPKNDVFFGALTEKAIAPFE
jgi:uncharacterized protein (TIGR04255 family)